MIFCSSIKNTLVSLQVSQDVELISGVYVNLFVLVVCLAAEVYGGASSSGF